MNWSSFIRFRSFRQHFNGNDPLTNVYSKRSACVLLQIFIITIDFFRILFSESDHLEYVSQYTQCSFSQCIPRIFFFCLARTSCLRGSFPSHLRGKCRRSYNTLLFSASQTFRKRSPVLLKHQYN